MSFNFLLREFQIVVFKIYGTFYMILYEHINYFFFSRWLFSFLKNWAGRLGIYDTHTPPPSGHAPVIIIIPIRGIYLCTFFIKSSPTPGHCQVFDCLQEPHTVARGGKKFTAWEP